MSKLIDKKRIAKNTLMLYIRMLLITIVSLYSSRVVLEVLGVEDFGIYNVVCGVVLMLSFLNNAMSSATQRFLSFELGRGNKERFRKVFTTSVIIHILIALIVVVLAESIGYWFLNYKMLIPSDRTFAANWIFQFAILTFVTKIISVPYNSCIISFENMNIYAYISIVEAILQLLVVIMLRFVSFDKLELYSVLIFLVAFIITTIYRFYCVRKYKECRLIFIFDLSLIKEMLSFCSWNLFGSIGMLAKFQGVNIVLNIFFGAAINAAWGIAQQVNSALMTLVANFTTALNPAIIKSYACEDYDNTTLLLFNGMKYSFVMASCIVFPFLLNTDLILDFWLKEPPLYSNIFVKLILFCALIDSILSPIGTVIQATGFVKWFQVIVGSLSISIVPITYFVFKFYHSPLNICSVLVSMTILTMIVRFIMLYNQYKYSMNDLWRLLSLMFTVTLFNLPLFLLQDVFTNKLINFFVTSLVSVLLILGVLYSYGMNIEERRFVSKKILLLIKR